MTARWERALPSATERRILGWALPLAALGFSVTVWPFPAPLGVIVNGALVGGRVALIALGIALVYRANRVINFAAGDLGQLPASLAVLLVLSLGWNYVVSAVLGLVAAIVLGVLVETLIIRRFYHSPRLIVTVATIGVAQVLTGAALFLPNLFGDLQVEPRLDPPFTASWSLPGVTFNAADLMTIVLVPICFIALALFMNRSTFGTAIRAAAERGDRASTLGIPVRRLHTIVWVIASVLAYVAMFLRAGVVGLPVGQVLGPSFLIQALAAAVIGRMERLPTIAIAAIGIGMVDQSMTFQPGNRAAFNDAVLFLIVLGALLLTKRPRVGRGGDVSTWQAAREVRPIPRELVRIPEVRYTRWGLGAVILAAVLALPAWLPQSKINLAAAIVIFGIVGLSLVVLTGWAGQVSLGQIAFVGIGAAVGGALTANEGLDIGIALIAGGLVGAVIAVIIGYPAIRRGGLTLPVVTLAFALLTSSYLLNKEFFDSWLPGGRVARTDFLGLVDISTETRYYYFCLVGLALMYLAARGIRRSRTGRVLIAIRENEPAARAYGISATRTTLAAFATSGFMAAFAGVLYVHHQTGLGTASYFPNESLTAFSMVVIGGLGSLSGALIGAFYVRGAQFFLPGNWAQLASGAGLLLVLMILPGGIGAAIADVRDAYLRWVARRRNLLVPSLLADRKEEPIEIPEDQVEAAIEAAEGEPMPEHLL
jgi:ABC-type branched-subunit amino acid transport system permease subunit